MNKNIGKGDVVFYNGKVWIVKDTGKTFLHNHRKVNLVSHNCPLTSNAEVVIGESINDIEVILERENAFEYLVHDENLNKIRADKNE